jgi:hypothetical protein
MPVPRFSELIAVRTVLNVLEATIAAQAAAKQLPEEPVEQVAVELAQRRPPEGRLEVDPDDRS